MTDLKAAGIGAALGGGIAWACMRLSGLTNTPTADEAETVLEYWFYGEDVGKKQHRLWFCAEGSARQAKVDGEIAGLFGGLMERAVKQEWIPRSDNPRELMAAIILLDQITRHVYRFGGKGRPGDETNELAVSYADVLFSLEKSWVELPPVMLVFALLPYRHHKSTVEGEKGHHQKALGLLEKIEARYDADRSVSSRFRTATVRRYQALCDVIPVEEGILEKEEFTPSEDVLSKKPREVLVRTIARFLINRDHDMDAGVVCVSLSGGVDSMVICDALAHLRDHPKPVERARKGQYTSAADRRVKHNILEKNTIGLVKKIVAVHIDYGNREASKLEADFLEGYCERRGITFIKKQIEDLRRATTSRDEYEALTRNIRYDEYRHAIRDHGVTGICLGHHSGDVVENLLSNANKGCGVLDLSGMRETSMMEDVPIWRPLLPHNKDEIFTYAHKYGVPYFKDTTPSWSTRGKLRRNLLPCLEDTYGSGTATNLHSLALESDACKAMVYDRLIQPYISGKIKRFPMGITLDITGYEDHGRLFWKEVFKHVQHSIFNTAMLSDTALREVAVRLALTGFEEGDKKYITAAQEGWVEPKKAMFWFFEKGTLYIPDPKVFETTFKTAPPVPLNTPTQVGVWEIHASIYPLSEAEQGDSRCTDHRALPVPCRTPPFTWDTFFSGQFTYHLQAPAGTTHLLFQNDSGAKAPWAWKQMHHRFHESIPICSTPAVTSDESDVIQLQYRYKP